MRLLEIDDLSASLRGLGQVRRLIVADLWMNTNPSTGAAAGACRGAAVIGDELSLLLTCTWKEAEYVTIQRDSDAECYRLGEVFGWEISIARDIVDEDLDILKSTYFTKCNSLCTYEDLDVNNVRSLVISMRMSLGIDLMESPEFLVSFLNDDELKVLSLVAFPEGRLVIQR